MLEVSQEELNEVIKTADGTPFRKEGRESNLTLRDVFLEAINRGKGEDRVTDSMRLFRLQEKIMDRSAPLVLDDTNLDDLKERGHERWVENVWVHGKLFTVLNRPVLDKLEQPKLIEVGEDAV